MSGEEKGCAAEVEVAAGGPSCVPVGGPRGAGGDEGLVEARRRDVVDRDRKGRMERWKLPKEARCRQRGQIIVAVVVRLLERWDVELNWYFLRRRTVWV